MACGSAATRKDGAKLRAAVLSLGVVVLAGAIACRPSGDPVRGAIDSVAAAARDRDASKLLENVAPDFQAADGSRRADVEQTVRRYFAAYESLDVELSDVTIERSESAALARFQAKLSGKARQLGGLSGLLPPTSTWRFEIRLVPDGKEWKIAWASWSQVS